MLEVKMLMDLGDGASVVGSPGYLSPADKARLDYLWRNRNLATGISYAGDVEGYSMTDGTGNVLAMLTVPELENIRAELAEVKEKVDALSYYDAVDVTPIEERLTAVESELTGADTSTVDELKDRLNEMEARLDAQEDEQREYMRRVDYDSATGVLSFKDGYNDAVYTVGGATFEPVTVEPATVAG